MQDLEKIINNHNHFMGGVDIADQYRTNIILITI